VLAHLPEPYPDELLLSWMARVARQNCLSAEQLARAIGLNRRTVCGSFGLPENLGDVAEALSVFRPHTVDGLVQRHTLLPYYCAYKIPERAEALQQLVKASVPGGVQMRAGLTMTPAARLTDRRFCPDCVANEMAALGESYWHRAHQLPGVFVCHRHGGILRKSLIPYGATSCASYLALPDGEPGAPCELLGPIATLHDLARRSAGLLECKPSNAPLSQLLSRYRAAVIRANLTWADGRLHSTKIRQAMLSCFSPEYLRAVGCEISNRGSWLTSMLEPTYAWRLVPLKHVLIEVLLSTLPPAEHLQPGAILALAELRGEAFVPRARTGGSRGGAGRKPDNWAAKDDALLQRLQASYRTWDEHKDGLISRKALTRMAGGEATIRAHASLLPKSAQFLSDLSLSTRGA
jgi:hypothetical protein